MPKNKTKMGKGEAMNHNYLVDNVCLRYLYDLYEFSSGKSVENDKLFFLNGSEKREQLKNITVEPSC